MRSIRLTIFALTTAFALAIGGGALAHPPGGTEDGSNNVDCHGAGVPGTNLTVDAHEHGVGACNDGGPVPIKGRVIVHASKLYVAADGASGNPPPLDGFIRVGVNGSGCGGSGNQDSHQGGSPGNCDAS